MSKRLVRKSEKNKVRYDLRRRPEVFHAGQLVFKRNYVLSDAARDFTAKLAPKFVGPFRIKNKLSPWTYELENSEDGRLVGVWHAKDLKPFCPSSP